MNYVVFVEAGRNGQQQIQKVSLSPEHPIAIGRAWQNNVIINDEYIDASHLTFSVNDDGSIYVADLCTANGTRLNKRSITGKLPYTIGEKLFIGESSVALYEMQTNVAPALKRDAVHTISNAIGSTAWVFVATVALLASLVASVYWQGFSEATGETVLNAIFGFGFAALIWCLLAGIIGKLFRNETYVKLHWIFASILSVMSVALTMLADILRFNLDTDISNVLLEQGVFVGLLALFAYGTLSMSTRLSTRKKLSCVSIIALAPVVIALIDPLLTEEHDTWTDTASIQRISQPPALFFRMPVTLNEHISTTDTLFTKLEEQIREQAPEAPDSNDDTEIIGNPIQITSNEAAM